VANVLCVMAHPDDEVLFLAYLSGLIDGEGCFLIPRNRGSYYCRFMIGMRADDRPLLEECKRRTGIGIVARHGSGSSPNPCVAWQVSTRKDTLRLIEILDAHPLRGKKRRDFEVWKEAVRATAPGPGRDWAYVGELKRKLEEGRKFDALYVDVPTPVEQGVLL
jgi:LAGLIDADG endonuclease